MNDFLTWQTLATFAGCSAGVAVITQFIKNAGVLKKVPTQWVSYFLAVILILGATYFTGKLTIPALALIPFNAVVVSLASNGAFSAIQRVSSTGNDTKIICGNDGVWKIVDKDGNTLFTLGSSGASFAGDKVHADAEKISVTSPETPKNASNSNDDNVVVG